ncbi:MAG: bifunctional D-glycero-beta-D-manno-heptose-7-phosphate kinase/D-glycero-beta-D-manno-heptose 1-phosphate adenylyltransferase HldE [Ferrovibrio sp.]|uniref:bifunctional D-glycero-beta-D-manno-heptose-7-phosphate kinase/D-glycero-beta-D-manno-heptose 1-phosphate adenylyltransferase HldE n=1 Tax=Ferrovibrio sp. TaxID=1917215 RepID=UPI002606779C|nr:bifunctional D-glycero-beta-D-manno-heptose-7-phosphate kinase/D-glycero-beta-D-manno-heptose 1-phosphate adenylyltransferase HldE [Ferrovibrio sp.]MCW0235381.1 bifunctional D-glycero-beta-D-manno-heptose-7-phosphate kinase/D-glycero-beta-D-manno-heptose 1-phosphate adenylyltransferase HldE [Ferrovibrio sp.]
MSDFAADPADFAAARVLVVGDVMLDRFVYGGVERISPEAPIPVMQIEREIVMPGGAGNVARNLAALGARVALFGLAGDDVAADQLNEVLALEPGIEAHLVVDETWHTIEKTRFIGSRQQLLRVDRESRAQPSDAAVDALIKAALEALADNAVLVLSDYAKGAVSDRVLAKLIKAAARAGKPVLVDPKGSDYRRYKGATLVTPNRAEAALATGESCSDDDSAVAAARKLVNDAGIANVLVTRGAAGMTLVQGQEAPLHLAAEAREVFDVSGAGDTVVATIAAALAVGRPLPQAARLANLAAGIVVGKIGTAVVHPEELRLALHMPDPHGIEAKIVTPQLAAERVALWRSRGERIGFTNGVFDLLHPGHLALLSDVRAQCDRLIVAINADASVKKLKGDSRPVQDERHRAQLLAALTLVDLVIVFAEDTPIPLLELLRPDLLVKGGDYTIDQVVGADIVRAYGGEVQVARHVAGQSTTATIKKLQS